jgi:hypothetical protein
VVRRRQGLRLYPTGRWQQGCLRPYQRGRARWDGRAERRAKDRFRGYAQSKDREVVGRQAASCVICPGAVGDARRRNNSTVALRCPPLVRVQRLIIKPMQERQRERIAPQPLHLPGPDSPSGTPVAIHVGMKRFEGDVDTPGTAGGVIRIAEDALKSADDIGASVGGDVVADPDVHTRALT